MGKYLIILSIVVILITMGCSGKEVVSKDKIPPNKPGLIPHLADPGDTLTSVYWNGAWVTLTDETNGIDAVPDVEGIRISWDHLIDLDLDVVKIWRFNDYSEPRIISTVQPTPEFFVDKKDVTMNGDSLYYTYSYFLEVFDVSGNSTKSDTVSYRLLEKQRTVAPANGATLTSMYGLNFTFDTSGDLSRYRILLFDEFHDLKWSLDIQTEHETSYTKPYTGPVFSGMDFTWRVDAFEWDNELNIYVGSESNESTFHVQ